MSIHHLDITKEHCPMTFVKTRLKLEQLKANDILEVLLNEGEPLQNVPRVASECGYEVLEVKPSGNYYLVIIKVPARLAL